MDIVFSFDTTGSMAPCIAEVRRRLDETVGRLFREFSDLRIGIIAHGDYCDNQIYEYRDLTTSEEEIRIFIKSAANTGGGDSDECYEYILHLVNNFNWQSSQKILIMIGDASPHPESAYKTDMFCRKHTYRNWREECKNLAMKGVKIYSAQALKNISATIFWKQMATLTGGVYLSMPQLSTVPQLLLGTVYNESGQIDQYTKELQKNGLFNGAIRNLINSMRGVTETATIYREGLIPVSPGRFQSFKLESDSPIKQFVESMDITFKKGRGFYELTKPSVIQEKKEVVIEDRDSGDMFTGEEARNLLGIPYGTRGKVNAGRSSKYNFFIQSTSVNRKLLKGTKFMYEVSE